MSQVLSEFSDRLMGEWLPTFCHDPNRQLALEGFDARNLAKVTERDARDFMRALASGVVFDTGGGRFRAFRSNANETIFDHGKKSEIPRPVKL